MSADQLQLVHTRVGWGMLPKKAETEAQRASAWRKVPRQGLKINALLSRYIAKLREIRSPLFLSDDNIGEFWKRYPDLQRDRPQPQINQKIAEINQKIAELKAERDPRRESERIEKQIWELQTRASCPIKPSEQIARDAIHADRPREAARIRKKPIIR
jgi:hypothetical protein